MTKVLHDAYRQMLLASTAPNLLTATLKVVALDASYTYSPADEFYDDLAGIIALSPALGTKTITDGTLDAADSDLGSPPGGDTITQLWLFIDTGSTATSRLVMYTDEDVGGSPLSVPTTGGTITLTFDAAGLFRV